MEHLELANELRDYLQLDAWEVVRALNATFGPTLVASMAGTRDSKAPIRWAKPGSSMRAEAERRVRYAYRVMTTLSSAGGERVARSWFITPNELLDEMSPIEALEAQRFADITAAANGFRDGVPAAASAGNLLPSSPQEASRPAATMRDVAELAGVSIKTVSNVVNSSARVSPATLKKVQNAVATLGYQVNMTARSLRQGRSGMIGLLIPELRVPYFAELAESVLYAAEEHGLTLLIEQTGALGQNESELLRGPRRRFTDGVLFSPRSMDPINHPELYVDYPMVLLGERIFDSRFDHVTMANVEASRQAVEHLADQGCRRIAVLGVHDEEPMGTAVLRYQGYREALEARGLVFDPRLVGFAERWIRASGMAAMNEVIDSGAEFDGVFAMNDALALGALPALTARGYRVPGDVKVIGFDDIDDAQYSDPPLSSIDPGRNQIAVKSVQLLVNRIAGDSSETERITADFSVVVRQSSMG